MSFLSLVFGLGGQNTTMGAVQLDALLTEESKLAADVTSYAVEDGTEISDHITQNPEELTLTGVIAGASTLTFDMRGRSKLIMNKDLIRSMHEAREPVTIVTGLDMYQDFAMTSAIVARDADGDRLRIEAKFKKIVKAQLSTAEVPQDTVSPSADGGATQQRAGKTAAKSGSVSDARADKSEVTEAQRESWLVTGGRAVGLLN